jgi:hypothetical protein
VMSTTAMASLVLALVAPLPAQSLGPTPSARDEEVIAAVVAERLRLGYTPSIGVPGDMAGVPLQEICLGLPGGKDPRPSLLRRLSRGYRITPLSQCPRDAHRLVVGPVRRLNRYTAEVDWSGLGNAGTFLVERRRGTWRVKGAIGGIVGAVEGRRPPNNEMQLTSHGQNGGSQLISVLSGHLSSTP